MEANFLRYKGDMVESIALFCEANKFKAKGLRQEQKFDVRFREGLLEQLRHWTPIKHQGAPIKLRQFLFLARQNLANPLWKRY
jgi:hypothetical protein